MSTPTPVTKTREAFYLTLIHLAGNKLLWPIVIVAGAIGLWLAWPYLIAAVVLLLKVLLGVIIVVWIFAVIICAIIDG